jgi:hypothetical protein
MAKYGVAHRCNHPVYTWCTLYKIGGKGLAVIQQRFNDECKFTYWDIIDEYLWDEIYLHPKFKEVFDERAGEPDENGLYPTVTIRQLMWALKMKPLPRQQWETVFDRRLV